MKNHLLTFSLALAIVLAGITLRHSVQGIGGAPMPPLRPPMVMGGAPMPPLPPAVTNDTLPR